MGVRNAESMGSYGSSWQHKGYCGSGNVAGLLDSLTGRTAVVCGNGEGVFQELDQALMLAPEAVIFAANDVGMYLSKLDQWVSLHADNLGPWKQVRWLHPGPCEDAKYHAIDKRPFIDYVWAGLTPLFCLSGYFALQIAYLMGAERIILCGCPGNQTPRFFEARAREDFGYGSGSIGSDKGVKEQIEREMDRLPEFKAAVRSMSGWTQEFFGGV